MSPALPIWTHCPAQRDERIAGRVCLGYTGIAHGNIAGDNGGVHIATRRVQSRPGVRWEVNQHQLYVEMLRRILNDKTSNEPGAGIIWTAKRCRRVRGLSWSCWQPEDGGQRTEHQT
jgi:hypothetical protein